eukprot:CAMPEP_0182595022 /NCGR_PEP_ID=MMETSP1324-20130603/81401_1 /TAXON_ID=236786 /ORGANISM="Florenciella sp., Strain RCC1587" /LENGTH=111 /DNA_ID=CAMNT_0024812605 /DNA_START=233 /DNA_END=568 /DNA_ORIENTATION=+
MPVVRYRGSVIQLDIFLPPPSTPASEFSSSRETPMSSNSCSIGIEIGSSAAYERTKFLSEYFSAVVVLWWSPSTRYILAFVLVGLTDLGRTIVLKMKVWLNEIIIFSTPFT